MTIATTTNKVVWLGNGSTTVFSYTFPIASASEVVLIYTDANGNQTTIPSANYSITGIGQPTAGGGTQGGTATYPLTGSPIADSTSLTLMRIAPFTQVSAFPLNTTYETALDLLAEQIQQLGEQTGRALLLNPTDNETINYLPPAAERANQFLGFNSAGQPVCYSSVASGSTVQATGGQTSATLAQRFGHILNVIDDFGAAGNGATDDSAAFTAALTSPESTIAPAATYEITAGFTLPFERQIEMQPGAEFAGTGTVTKNGILVQWGYNPAGQTGWGTAVASSYEGLSVDFGGYGPRNFVGTGCPTAINGSIVIPAGTASTIHNGFGLSGYVKNSSTPTSGVGVYAQADCEAAGAQIWGYNCVCQDNGFATSVFGIEVDLNITNASTVVYGIDVTGGSTVEPTASVGVFINPIGTFASPANRWSYGISLSDGASIGGILLGAGRYQIQSGSQPIQAHFTNSALQSVEAWSLQSDSSGNVTLAGSNAGSILQFAVNNGGTSNALISMFDKSLGFYGATPVAQPTITGSRGSATATVLGSLLNYMASQGLLINNTTA